MINCIIVDDEPIARRGMKRLVESVARLNLLAALPNADNALRFVEDNDVDLLFLDIQMPGISGLNLARRLPEKTMVVFTTAYPEYALESYSVDAIGYLLKPIDPDLFERTVSKAVEYADLLAAASKDSEAAGFTKDYAIVKADRRFHRIPHDDIIYVEGFKDYVIIHLADGRRLVTRSTIKNMEEMLPRHIFARVSKSFIVKLSAVDSFDTNDLFIGSLQISIGSAFRDRIMDLLMK